MGARLWGWWDGASGSKAGQGVERGPVDHDRLGVDRPAMHDAVADPHDLQARAVGLDPGEDSVHRVFLRRDLGQGIAFVDDDRTVFVTDEEVGGGADPLEYAPVQPPQIRAGDREHGELHARRSGVQDADDPGHRSSLRSGTLMSPPPGRPVRRAWASEEAHGAGGQASLDVVGAAGQDDRHAGPEDDARGVGVGHEGELLGQHVAGLQVGDQEHVGIAGDLGPDVLDLRGGLADRVVHRQRPVDEAAGDLAAVGHLAQGGGLQRGRDLGIDRLDRREDGDLGQGDPEGVGQVDRVLANRDLVLEGRVDIDRAVGEHQGLVVRRYIHDEGVAEPPLGAQAGLSLDHLVEQHVGVQRPLDEHLGLALADQFDRSGGRLVVVGGLDDSERGDVQAVTGGDLGDPARGPDQDRLDEPGLGRLDGGRQRHLVARVGHGRAGRRQPAAALEQRLVLAVRLDGHLRGLRAGHADVLGRRGRPRRPRPRPRRAG